MDGERKVDESLQWLIPEAEAEPVWDLFERTFRVIDGEYDSAFGDDPPFFVNAHWTMVALVNNLQRLALPPYAPNEVRQGRLTWEDWKSFVELDLAVEREGFYERDELGPLLDIMAGEGANTLYLINVLRRVPVAVQAGAATRAGLEAAVLAMHHSPMGSTERLNFVFDDTGRWGLYIGEDNVAVLAGQPEIIERYLPEVGGLEVLQQRFADRISEEVDPRESLYRLRAARAYRNWYAAMRWDWPFPEPPTAPEQTGQAET